MSTDDLRAGADLLLCNTNVITLDPERPRAQLVAVRGNRILAVGDADDLDLFTRAGTRVMDCEGGTIIPGFNDAHCHPLSLAISLLSVDCSARSVSNIAGIQARLGQRAAQIEEGRWIRAVNYDEFHLDEGRAPDRWELDQAAARHPVILIHHTAGSCVLNSLALQLAGLTRDTPNPPGGVIHRDPRTGEPDGRVSGRNELVERAIPPIGGDELERGMKLANREFLSHGITSLQDTGWNNGWRHWRTWQRLVDRGVVVPRVSMMLGSAFLEEPGMTRLAMGAGDSRLRVSGIKLALDESTGCPQPPQQDVEHAALRACRAGFCVGFHVSDIRMLETSLAAIRFVLRELPGVTPRFRLEHCTICPPELLPKIRASRAIVVTQPAFLYHLGQPFRQQALTHQANWFQPLESLRRWGVKVAFGSDSPLVPSNPLTGICAAVTRRTQEGELIGPQESIPALAALEMYALGGAQASFEDAEKGSIRPGKLADLVVLNADPTGMVPERIPGLRVLRCIVDGKVVWES